MQSPRSCSLCEQNSAYRNDSSGYLLLGPVQLALQVAQDGKVRVEVVGQQVDAL